MVRTETSAPFTSIEEDIQKRVIGIGVDQSTGLVYCTTEHNDFRVYQSSLGDPTDIETADISGPAGVAVPRGDVSYKPDVFVLSKADNVLDCVSPLDQFTYSISYSANGYADTAVVIIDYLPFEVDYISYTGGGVYSEATHTVTWVLGDLTGGESGTLQIMIGVNYFARPGMTIVNGVEMEGDTYYSNRTEDTEICCWYGGQTIYVDQDATGFENGTSWVNAYTDLQDALAHVRTCRGAVTAIWVAAGTYKPTESPSQSSATFEVIDGVDMYGHFGGIGTYETSINQRDFENPDNETRLEGQIGASPSSGVQYVVTAKNITRLIFDGFTVRGSYGGAGILIEDCPNADLRIIRCKVEANGDYGIQSRVSEEPVSNFELQDCVITGNSTHGLHCTRSWPVISGTTFDGESQTQCGISAGQSAVDVYDSEVKNHTGSGIYASATDLDAERCLIEDNGGAGVACVGLSGVEVAESRIRSNGYDGIFLEDSLETKITNNWICENIGVGSEVYGGIYLRAAIDQAQIRNNTICGNNPYGIYLESGTEPEVVSCIVYDNTTQIGTGSAEPLELVSYSCVEGWYAGTGNISAGPVFVNAGAGDYHLKKESPCVDSGKVNSTEPDEVDIDANPRVMGGRVDMGGDEDYPHCDPQYDDWVLFGRPDCWMWPYQCDGDASGMTYLTTGWRVYTDDLNILAANWKKKIGGYDPANPCADINHKGYLTTGWRVYTDDLDIVATNWKKKAGTPPTGLAGDCVERGCGEGARSGSAGTALSGKELLKWLAEIWLDPEVRKSIDEEKSLKFYESLKGL